VLCWFIGKMVADFKHAVIENVERVIGVTTVIRAGGGAPTNLQTAQ